MTDIGKERGWPPMTRASFDAQRGRNGALPFVKRYVAGHASFPNARQMAKSLSIAIG
jgi:hypothetical protein